MGGVRLTARRAVAYVVDVLALALVLVPLAALVAGSSGNSELTGTEVWLRSLVLVSLPAWTYFVVTEHRWGRGIGKRLLGLRTVDRRSGRPPSLPSALVRTIITLLPWELTHLAFFALAPRLGATTPAQMAVAALAYVLLAVYVVATVRTGGAESPADRLAGTAVRATAGAIG